jgi:hypothetical protein
MTTVATRVRGLADGYTEGSLSNKMRTQRFARFEALIADLPKPVSILDVGGTVPFWEQRGWAGRSDAHITLVNIKPRGATGHDNISAVTGNATDLADIADGQYDVAFSNSVIEHLYTREAQAAMAREVQRVARAYWVQTPNFWFPMEPHFLVPGWQFLPRRLRVEIIHRRECGWRGPYPDIEEARRVIDEVKLLGRRDLARMFPGATIMREKFSGLTKSFVVHRGL